ncbi:hypothetical protein [Streptomyces sp. NPDC093094]
MKHEDGDDTDSVTTCQRVWCTLSESAVYGADDAQNLVSHARRGAPPRA